MEAKISLLDIEKESWMKAYQSVWIRRTFLVLLVLLSTASVMKAQVSPGQRTQATPALFRADSITLPEQRRNALGLDILVSNSGFGLGVFYRRQYTDDLYGFGTFSISEAKDDREVERFDIFGRPFVQGKVNRFLLLPLIFGVQYRLFREDIADNFRPYLTAALGPTLVYSAPDSLEFFNSLGHGQAHYTVGGYVGFGAFFGLEKSNLVGLNFRYYFVPLRKGIKSLQIGTEEIHKKEFGGFFITLNVGTMY